MRCKRWNEKIGPYLDGELAPAEVRALEQHLARCYRCAVALDEAWSMAFAVARLPWAKAPEGLVATVIGRIESAAALSCATVRPELAALADAEMEPARQKVIEAHLALCPACGQVFSQVRAIKEAAQHSLLPVRAPRGLLRAILAATTRPREAGWLEQILLPRRVGYALVGATVAAAFVGLLFYLPRGGQIPPGMRVVKAPGTADVAEAPPTAAATQEQGLFAGHEATTVEKPEAGWATGTVAATAGSRALRATSPGEAAPVRIVRAPIPAFGVTLDKGRRGAGRPSAKPGRLPSGTEVVSTAVAAETRVVSPSPAAEPSSARPGKPAPVVSVTARADFDLSPSDGSLYSVSDLGLRSRAARPSSTPSTAPALLTVPF